MSILKAIMMMVNGFLKYVSDQLEESWKTIIMFSE